MRNQNTGRQIFFSALAVLATAAVCYPFSTFIGYRSVALILLLVVSVLAMRQGLPAVLVAAILSALVWDFFFIPPHFTFTIGSGEDVLLIVMYFIVVLLNGVINYRLRQMAQLRRETEERERSLKLYNTLFNSLSHDLRTPIAAVLGAADMLSENTLQLSENQRAALISEISGGALRLHEQVENLLNMSRLEAGIIQPRREWCDVADLVYGVLHKLPPDLEGRTVKVSIPADFPLVQLDFGLTAQMLQNLLINARRHTPAGTMTRVAASIHPESRGHFEENKTSGELQSVQDLSLHRLTLEVSDNGPGIPPEALGQVFDKFYRSSATKADGTGLGLFVVRGFTEAQGGEISVRNLPSGGACFTLEFPTPILNQTIHHD